MNLAGGVRVAYGQFYVTDGWAEQPLLETAFAGQTNGLCGAGTGDGLFLVTGLHTGTVPVEVEVLTARPALEPEWEEAVEVSLDLSGPDLIVLGWGGESTHTVPVPAPGPYRIRYCARGMDEGNRQDVTLEGESSPDRYRLQVWPATAGPDVILRRTSEVAAYWHGSVATIPPPPESIVTITPVPAPGSPLTVITVLADAGPFDVESVAVAMPHPPSVPSWVALLTLMVHGPEPEPTLSGVIRSGPNAASGAAGPATDGNGRRVWRDETLIRVERIDGAVELIVGQDTVWWFASDAEPLVAAAAGTVHHVPPGTELLTRRSPSSFLGDDFTRPTGPIGSTVFLGRLAWTVELAPPPHKPHPIQLVVDAETGIILQRRCDGLGTVDEWAHLVVGEPLDPATFRWDGPVRGVEEEWGGDDAEPTHGREWFGRHVGDGPFPVELDLDVMLHEHDEATGAFEASLGQLGSLARRPRSDEPWPIGWMEVQHRWSTPRWDWALTFHDATPTARSVESLRARLGDGR